MFFHSICKHLFNIYYVPSAPTLQGGRVKKKETLSPIKFSRTCSYGPVGRAVDLGFTSETPVFHLSNGEFIVKTNILKYIKRFIKA